MVTNWKRIAMLMRQVSRTIGEAQDLLSNSDRGDRVAYYMGDARQAAHDAAGAAETQQTTRRSGDE